ncbi:MAG: restriction endonuclease subunit S [Bacteroidaceae bacterium]|nr:restriction endonuclease subunit S [Bacteroidaceae bacterium]
MNKAGYKRLGDYIREVNVRNRELKVTNLLGVSISKEFMPSIANTIGTDMSTYKIVERNQLVYIADTSRRGDKIAIGLLEKYDNAIVSQAYTVFEVIDHEQLLPEYLMMWFRRPEFDRYARFHSHGSAREVFDWDELCDVMLPIPSITRQREIVSEYETVANRIRLNNQMIQHLEATAQALYRKMFVDNIDKENLPEGWRMGAIEDLSEFVVAGVIPNYIEEGEYKVLGQRCVHDHIIDMSFVKSHIPKSNCLFVQDGDILINSTGSGTLGRVGQIISAPMNLAFDSNMTLVRPIGEYAIDYLGLAIFEKENYFVQISQGSTNQTRLYCSMVKPAELLIPSMDELEKFKNYVHPMRNEIEHRRFENEKLTELQSLLLAKMGQ